MANGNRGQPPEHPSAQVDSVGCVTIVGSVLFVVVFYAIAFYATARMFEWIWGE